jgi:hypothetical protein
MVAVLKGKSRPGEADLPMQRWAIRLTPKLTVYWEPGRLWTVNDFADEEELGEALSLALKRSGECARSLFVARVLTRLYYLRQRVPAWGGRAYDRGPVGQLTVASDDLVPDRWDIGRFA